MMRKPLFAVLWIGVVALLEATPLYAVEEILEITGQILEVQNANATIVTISVPKEGDVPISNEGKGKELKKRVYRVGLGDCDCRDRHGNLRRVDEMKRKDLNAHLFGCRPKRIRVGHASAVRIASGEHRIRKNQSLLQLCA